MLFNFMRTHLYRKRKFTPNGVSVIHVIKNTEWLNTIRYN